MIEGTVSLFIEGHWTHAERGSYALIPGGTPHNFENHGAVRRGFISIDVPRGFESRVPEIVEWFVENPLGHAVGK